MPIQYIVAACQPSLFFSSTQQVASQNPPFFSSTHQAASQSQSQQRVFIASMADAVAEIEEPSAAPREPDEKNKKNIAAAELELPAVPWLPEVAKRYRPHKKLGDGMFGEVYKAWDRQSECFVAVKRLSGKTDDRFVMTSRQYLNQEVMSLTACLGHPCIVKILDNYCSRDDGDSYIVTEYAGPMNLREYINKRRCHGLPFDEDEVRDIMEQLLAGAKHAHKVGVLHRDIVPENVVVDLDAVSGKMVYKICGFGLSKLAAQADDDGFRLQATPKEYRAPELYLGSKEYELSLGSNKYDDRVDTWSLGCIMADLIAGDIKPNLEVEWEMQERPVSPAKVVLIFQKAAGLFLPEFTQPQQMLLLSADGLKVFEGLLKDNPKRRLSAAAALKKRWFRRRR